MRIHVTAVCGTGMGALAGLLKELGHEVSGSDTVFSPPMGPALRQWGIRLLEGFLADHIDRVGPDAVVIGNVCRKDNPEAQRAAELGIPRLHLADALQQFALRGTSKLVVCGTHGKTTTSALCSHLLRTTGFDPGFLIGGVPQGASQSFRPAGKRHLKTAVSRAGNRATPFVLEGDEYDTAFWEKTAKFLHYGAEVAILTSIEHDHIDIYPTAEAYFAPFEQFVRKLPASGLLIAYAGDAAVRQAAEFAPCEVAYYAVEGDPTGSVPVHWLAAPARITPEATTFDLYAGGVLAGRFMMPMSGRHNLRNVTAALAAAAHGYGADLRSLAEPLAHFAGVKRRQELLGQPRGIFVYDDFAHHPTAVRETLVGLRARHPSGRLIALFEPKSATACRRLHQQTYVESLGLADRVLLAPVGRQELPPEQRLDTSRLARELSSAGTPAEAARDSEEIYQKVLQLAEPGDAIVLLSNGNFQGLHQKLLGGLGEAHQLV